MDGPTLPRTKQSMPRTWYMLIPLSCPYTLKQKIPSHYSHEVQEVSPKDLLVGPWENTTGVPATNQAWQEH